LHEWANLLEPLILKALGQIYLNLRLLFLPLQGSRGMNSDLSIGQMGVPSGFVGIGEEEFCFEFRGFMGIKAFLKP